MSTKFNCQKHFYFKLFSLFKQFYITIQFSVSTVSMSKTVQFQTIQYSIITQFKCKYSSIVKTILLQAIQFCQSARIQLIQSSISTDPVHKTLVCLTTQFSWNSVSMTKKVLFKTIQFSISTQFKCKYSLSLAEAHRINVRKFTKLFA